VLFNSPSVQAWQLKDGNIVSSTPGSQADLVMGPRALRDMLGRFATGVTVMTARGSDGELVGITVNSFTSVSLDPPLILWCLADTSGQTKLFQSGFPFVVNILSDDQLEQAKQFARSGPTEFQGAHFQVTQTGLPRLEGCVGALECEVTARYPGGDHVIVLGRVTALHAGGSHPLVFYAGHFKRLAGSHLGSEGRPAWFPWQDD
jgi:flavin reductase (DIM6/NTAB) family NADH-FMN oxidoreductase RutF